MNNQNKNPHDEYLEREYREIVVYNALEIARYQDNYRQQSTFFEFLKMNLKKVFNRFFKKGN